MTQLPGDQTHRTADGTSEVIPPWIGIGRAIGGAIIFSLPMMMTMEMWHIGFYMKPLRLIALILFSFPLFIGVSSMIGFKHSKNLWDNVVDVLVAYAVAFLTAGSVLVVFGIITQNTAPTEIFSMILLQTVPGSLGALLARSLIGSGHDPKVSGSQTYREELIILLTGSLFLAFNVAPTEEMVLISYLMSSWHIVALMLLTLVIMHTFNISSESGTHQEVARLRSQIHIFLRFTSIGYVLAFAVSVFVLWVFGRADDESLGNFLNTAVVLAFPAGVGAAASRLIV